jgi:CDP-diacylglycerol--glycerol-3-phosphate 3-phosphatidyltransferase
MSPANWLTVLRIVLIPLFIVLLFQKRMDLALLAFVLAAATDVLDGFVARRTRVTSLGRFLDPAADKLMLVSAFIVLPMVDAIPAWITIVVVSRDVIISLGYLVIYLTWGATRVAVRPLGKITTLFQSLAVGFIILTHLLPFLSPGRAFAAYGVVVITALSGLDYIIFGVRWADQLMAAGKTVGSVPSLKDKS